LTGPENAAFKICHHFREIKNTLFSILLSGICFELPSTPQQTASESENIGAEEERKMPWPFRGRFLILRLLFGMLVAGCSHDSGNGGLSPEEIVNIAADAYVYGYAPVAVAKKAYDQTHPTREAVYAPVNQLHIYTEMSGPDNALFVTPNANVHYSSAHPDLSGEPMVLYTPAVRDRYFSWQAMDAFTNSLAYIGSRAPGAGGGCFIATAASGSLRHPDSKVSKYFRNHRLSAHALGRVLAALCILLCAGLLAAIIRKKIRTHDLSA
jgi:hypothetical protein